MVQRRVAIAVGGTRVGTVGEQGHHRLGAAMPAVTGGGQQRVMPRCGAFTSTPRAISSRSRRRSGSTAASTAAALVAPVRVRQRIRIGTGLQQLQAPVDAAMAGGFIQRRGQLLRRHRLQRRGFDRSGEHRFALVAGRGQWACAQRHQRCRRHPLQQQVQHGRQQHHRQRGGPVCAFRQQPRPGRQHHQRGQRDHQRGHTEAAPCPGHAPPAPASAGPGCRRGVRHRSTTAVRRGEQAGTDQHAQAQHRRKAAAVAQRRQRPGQQQRQQQRRGRPQRQQRRQVPASDHLQRQQRAAATPP